MADYVNDVKIWTTNPADTVSTILRDAAHVVPMRDYVRAAVLPHLANELDPYHKNLSFLNVGLALGNMDLASRRVGPHLRLTYNIAGHIGVPQPGCDVHVGGPRSQSPCVVVRVFRGYDCSSNTTKSPAVFSSVDYVRSYARTKDFDDIHNLFAAYPSVDAVLPHVDLQSYRLTSEDPLQSLQHSGDLLALQLALGLYPIDIARLRDSAETHG